MTQPRTAALRRSGLKRLRYFVAIEGASINWLNNWAEQLPSDSSSQVRSSLCGLKLIAGALWQDGCRTWREDIFIQRDKMIFSSFF